eukprot:jgi/Ulvmu1/506/UM001_0514.1
MGGVADSVGLDFPGHAHLSRFQDRCSVAISAAEQHVRARIPQMAAATRGRQVRKPGRYTGGRTVFPHVAPGRRGAWKPDRMARLRQKLCEAHEEPQTETAAWKHTCSANPGFEVGTSVRDRTGPPHGKQVHHQGWPTLMQHRSSTAAAQMKIQGAASPGSSSTSAHYRMAPVSIRTKGWATMTPPHLHTRHQQHPVGVSCDPAITQPRDELAACPLNPLPASSTRLGVWKQAQEVRQAEQAKHTSHYKLQGIARVYPRVVPPAPGPLPPAGAACSLEFGSWDCLDTS